MAMPEEFRDILYPFMKTDPQTHQWSPSAAPGENTEGLQFHDFSVEFSSGTWDFCNEFPNLCTDYEYSIYDPDVWFDDWGEYLTPFDYKGAELAGEAERISGEQALLSGKEGRGQVLQGYAAANLGDSFYGKIVGDLLGEQDLSKYLTNITTTESRKNLMRDFKSGAYKELGAIAKDAFDFTDADPYGWVGTPTTQDFVESDWSQYLLTSDEFLSGDQALYAEGAPLPQEFVEAKEREWLWNQYGMGEEFDPAVYSEMTSDQAEEYLPPETYEEYLEEEELSFDFSNPEEWTEAQEAVIGYTSVEWLEEHCVDYPNSGLCV